MIKRLLIVAFAVVTLAVCPAQAQQSKPQLATTISTCFPNQTSGAITPASVLSCMLTFMNSWQQYAGVRASTTTTDMILSTDYGQIVTYNNASSVAVALPQATGSFATFNVYVSNLGAGTVTITPTTSTINGASSLSLSQNRSVWIVSDGTNYQVVGLANTQPITCGANTWVSALSSLGVLTCTQPAFSNLSGQTTFAQFPNVTADNLIGNPTGSATTPTNVPLTNCANALTYSTSTHAFGCNAVAGTGTVTTPSAGIVSSTTSACSQSANQTTFSVAECVNAQTGTSYAIQDSDRAKLVTASNSSAQAYTIAQAGASTTFQAGWFTEIANVGTGTVTITPTTSTINGASSLLLFPGERAKLTSDGTNYQLNYLVAINGPWHLLNTLTASNSATLTDTTSITSAFSEYEIVLENIVPASNAITLNFEFQVGGSFLTSSYISTALVGTGSAASSANLTTGVVAGYPSSIPNAAPGLNGRYLLSNPAQTLTCKIMYGDFSFLTGSAMDTGTNGGCYNGGSGAITGIQLLAGTGSSGNITSGKMKIYGRVN